ncbi:hypothetical protein DL93DRAFT_2077931 [Clavulina sp. PMI_390]|nr:hypothetical protein DL93DRAFT_2077931 [Clavulina sp. PMI_390]
MTDTLAFSRHLPAELRHDIIAYLPLIDLKSYSLCCRAFNADSEPLVSHSIAVAPWAPGAAINTLHEFAAFIMGNHRRAASIRSLSLYTAVHTWQERGANSATENATSDYTLDLALQQALSLVTNLKRLRIMPAKHSEEYYAAMSKLVTYPQDLFQALIAASFSHQIETLVVANEPVAVTRALFDAYPNITTLSMPLDTHPSGFPANSLHTLRRARGNAELLGWLSGRADLLEFQSSEYRLDSVAFQEHIRGFPSLQRLSCAWMVRNDHDVPHLSSFAHPTIQELEILPHYHQVDPVGTSLPLQFAVDTITPHSFAALPCLKFLHIGHFGVGIVRYLAGHCGPDLHCSPNGASSQPGSPVLDISQALKSLLNSYECPTTLLRVWIDVGGTNFHFKREAEMQLAFRIRAERDVGGEWDVNVEKCAPHERLVNIQQLS